MQVNNESEDIQSSSHSSNVSFSSGNNAESLSVKDSKQNLIGVAPENSSDPDFIPQSSISFEVAEDVDVEARNVHDILIGDLTESSVNIQSYPRLVKRNLPHHQSKNEIAIVNSTHFRVHAILTLSRDWYHVFLRIKLAYSLLFLLSTWTLFIILFALIYEGLDRATAYPECRLGKDLKPINFTGAFAFSLETCTTVGYTLPYGVNNFFETRCGEYTTVIFFQMVWSMLCNAFLISFLFNRLARAENRGAQVLFSNQAIIEKRGKKWYIHARVYDNDSSKPLVETHVRMYCVSWKDYANQSRDMIQPHLLHAMRLLQPNDELGGMLYTSVPVNVTHQIDIYSPLCPRRKRYNHHVAYGPGLALREIDHQTGNRNCITCPVCGEAMNTHDLLRRHITYYQMLESRDEGFPIEGSHRDPKLVTPELFVELELTEEEILKELQDKEIMVVLEGIEPIVSGTFQAIQSYTKSNVVFGGRFSPCMSQKNGKIYVDLDRFHDIEPPSDMSVRNYSQIQR